MGENFGEGFSVTRRARRIYGYGIAALTSFMAVLLLANPGLTHDLSPPSDVREMAAWLNEHPADWLTASELADHALDASVPQRRELWHAAYDLASHVAPRRPNAPAAFVRAGLFHWYELDAADRKQVLEVAAPLLREPAFFGTLYAPLFDLTRDFAYLRHNAPPTLSALEWLSELAVQNGLFAEYREIREAQRKERMAMFERVRHTEHPAALIDLLPEHLDARDEPLVQAVLEEIDRKPFDTSASRHSEDLVLFALRNHLKLLPTLAPLIETPGALTDPTRARLALALGNPGLASKVELTSATTRSAEWLPYHLERAIFEANHGERSAAESYLARTAMAGVNARVLAAAEQVATILGDPVEAARARRELLAVAANPRRWLETCGENVLCDRAITRLYVAAPDKTIRIEATVLDGDEIAPYLEIYVDDGLVAEGDVRNQRVFESVAAPGLHRVEVRLVNRYTRNRVQRRVRLS